MHNQSTTLTLNKKNIEEKFIYQFIFFYLVIKNAFIKIYIYIYFLISKNVKKYLKIIKKKHTQ